MLTKKPKRTAIVSGSIHKLTSPWLD